MALASHPSEIQKHLFGALQAVPAYFRKVEAGYVDGMVRPYAYLILHLDANEWGCFLPHWVSPADPLMLLGFTSNPTHFDSATAPIACCLTI